MKTQIITLAAHDDLVSIRDRMSWAKAPRILLLWPAREQVSLQPLDLRILQQHARELGAELGLVCRGESIRRDARAFGIPVFRSSVDAQRLPWVARNRRGRRRLEPIHTRLARLRALRLRSRPSRVDWLSKPPVRMSALVLAVVSVFAIASVFVPRATIRLTPETQEQALSITVDLVLGDDAAAVQSGLATRTATAHVNGQQTMPVVTRSEVAMTKASGTAKLQNLSGGPLLVPAGTVVYALTPKLTRYVTLQDTRLDPGSTGTAVVPIEAVEGGTEGNLPADALGGAEGSLSASVAVSNPEAITGGKSDQLSVPSQEDRHKLRTTLEQGLAAQAQAAIQSTLGEGDILLPATLVLKSVDREEFDPAAGKAGGVLSLMLEATYQGQYVRGDDLRALAAIALDAQVPSGYVPQDDSLNVQVNEVAKTAIEQAMQLKLELRRTLNRRIDLASANQMVRGLSPARADQVLQDAFPLATAPEIHLKPAWWPWMPLIPFRIEMIGS